MKPEFCRHTPPCVSEIEHIILYWREARHAVPVSVLRRLDRGDILRVLESEERHGCRVYPRDAEITKRVLGKLVDYVLREIKPEREP